MSQPSDFENEPYYDPKTQSYVSPRATNQDEKLITPKERYEIKRRAKRAIHCSCGATITGSGNWKVAHIHLGMGHVATQGRVLPQ